MNRHAGAVFAAALSALTCGATFLFALYRQLALVEVTASLATGVEVYFLSSSIGDWLENKPRSNRLRLGIGVALAFLVVLYFVIARELTK